MTMKRWFTLFLGYLILMTGMLACAKTERAFTGTGRVVTGTITGTKQFIEERVRISGQEDLDPENPQYWQMWQDSQGGG